MPGHCVALHIMRPLGSGKGRQITVHLECVSEQRIIRRWRSLGIEKINAHGIHTIAVRGSLAAKEVPAGQRGAVLRQMWRGVKTVR